MKRILSLLTLAVCAIFMVSNAKAQVITAERASEIANQFFANGKQKSAAFRSTSATLTQSIDSRAITGESNDAPTFHILTGASGKGFVIVSGEETENPIIGYSFDGTINTDEMSTGMVDYLTDIDAQVKALRKSNAANPQKAAARSAMQKATATETGGTIVVELNTAQWAQGSPYNNYCFLEGATGTTKASTGCVPTAYSILCYYHKWPESAKEVTVYHANTDASMTLGHTYDYESMSNVSTEAGANAVATLMRDLGWAYQVSYGVGNTGTGNKGEGPGTLMDVFNYKSETPCNHGNYTSNRSTLGNDELWMQYIKESLDAGLPIPYSSTTSAAGTARHIYILDGYTNNNYFHFNWGWGGNGNGWFTLNNMVVDTSSDYSNGHKAYFKLMPNKTPRTVTATTNSSSMGTVSINGGTAGNSVSAEVTEGTKATLTAHPADGYALANWTKNGVIVGTKNPIQVTVGESGNDYVANFDDAANVQIEKDCTFNISSVTTSGVNGSYCSTWTTSDGIVLSCSKGSEPAYALSTSVNTFFAKAPVGNSETLVSDITYTLTAPEGYVIKSYSFKGKSPSGSYTIDVTVGGNTTNVTNASAGVVISASDINAQSTSFVLGSTYTGRAGLSIMEDGVTVTIQSEGGASTPTPEPEPEPTPATYTITTTASPAEGGTAKFAVGTGSQKTQGDVENGTEITLYATANTGYNFVNWTLGGNVIGTDATCNVSVSQASNYVANFEAVQQTYPDVDGQTHSANYLTSATTTGAIDNVTYSANAHPGVKLVTVPGIVRVGKGDSFTLNLIANSLSSSTSAVAEDMRYCHASLYTDFDRNYKFEEDTKQRWGEKPPTNNVAGNYSTVMTINHTITVPADAPLGTSHVRIVYTNAWTNWPVYGTTTLDKGIVYDFVVEVVETVSITASASTGGTVKINNEAIETKKVIKGSEVTLTATSQNGHEFVNWTKNGAEVSTEATYTFNATEAASYVANFQAQADPLAGKWFRINAKNTTNYLNIATTAHQDGSTSGVTVVAKNENSDTQIFLFEQSGNGYKLKAKSGNYIKCWEWNANANATAAADATELTFETTGNELEYLIKWENPNRDDYFKTQAVSGTTYVFCDAASTAATTWVLEEVVETPEPEEPEEPQEQFPDGAYKVYWQADNRGYLAYYSGRQDEAVLADVTLGTHGSNHYTSTTEGIDLVWYLITASDGKRYLFHAATGSFLGANPSVQSNGTGNKLSTTEAWPIAVEENTHSTRQGHYIITTVINGTKNLLCSGCGTSSFNGGHSVRWLVVNDANQKDGGAPLQLVKVDNVTVSDDVMNAVRAVIEPRTFKFQAVVENWRDNNPNTHLGTITIGGTPLKLTPEHRTASELTMPLAEGSALAFTRKYRGFEFQGFYIGTTELGINPTLTAENIAAINETTPLVAKFTATDDVTLFYDDDEFSYRIPAIAKTGTNRLVAISDYRHSHDDIGRDNHHTGTLQVDLVMRTSEDNGLTWTAKQTIAEGTSTFGYGDAAVAVNGENILVMAVAGNVFFTNATATNKQKTYRIYSTNNGQSWEKQEVSNNLYDLFPNANGMFFGSGKLVVDPDFNGTGNARVYGAMLLNDGNNYVLYSDNWGETWNILGDRAAASANEPKVEILPNGQILLSARRNGGRTFNVFTYTDKANNAGTWSTANNGCGNGGNGTNGEIICLDAKRTNGKPTKILLQSQPNGSDRRNVSIWYKEISADETYTGALIASEWTMGKQVSTQLSAYSAMCLQANGEVALFFEEAPCHNDDATYGYSMVYVPLTIEEATGDAFLNPNADVEYVPVEFNVELTDAQGNIYRETLDYIPDDVAAALTAKYPFITLGENGVTADNKYTNTVTLPFKVSNADTTTWYNIYWPANTQENGYPVYLSAASATDTYVPKVTEAKAYGESSYNTLNNGDKIAWSIYSVNNSFEFIFKNKLTGKYIQATGVATGNAQNVKYAEESKATAFTLLKKTGNYAGEYALVAKVSETTGYLCSTSATGYSYATHYNGNGHEGAWVKFVAAPDYQAIVDALIADINKFGAGNGLYETDNAISNINKDALATMPINSLNTQKEAVQTVKDSYSEITLTVPVANSGSVKIKEEAVSNKFVKKGEVTIEAVPAAGYYFVNWTRPAAQESAMARAAEARNAIEVSTDNPYTFNLTDAVSLDANFDLIVVTATLTDGQGNQYIVELDGFTNGITKETIAAKLVEKHPYITLGTEEAGITLEGGDAAYTYTNTVELPFKVTNTTYMWHNIYWPSNTRDNDYPVYWSASSAEDTYVPKVTANYAYGANPNYNTKDGNDKISWAIYNVNNSFEFIFKNKVTQKYIQVTGVADGNAQNVVYVEDADEATAFTIEKKPAGNDYYTSAQYSLAAYVGETKGYICSTSAGYDWATHYNSNGHQGAWIEFVESPDYYSKIMDLGIVLGMKFGGGDGKCIITEDIQEVIDAMQNSGSITLNALTEYASRVEEAINNWPAVSLTINPVDCGTTSINGEENVVHKYVPNGYELALVATPAEGYHFDKWVDGTTEITTAEYTKTINGGKGDVITLTADFAKNTYEINVLAGEGGIAYIAAPGTTNATVEHGDAITLTADANDGYEFVNWTKGTDAVSTDATYTFNATDAGEYVANFKYVGTATITAEAITIGGENGGTVKVTMGTTESESSLKVEKNSEVTLEATAAGTNYKFAGWYNQNDECVSTNVSYTFTATESATYSAKFIKQVSVKIEMIKNGYAFAHIGNEATLTSKVFDYGTTVDIHAVSYSTDAVFAYWTLDGTKLSQDADYSFVAENDSYYFVANFNYKAQIAVVSAGNGIVYIDTEGVTNKEMATGNTVTITAKASTGYAFDYWALSSDESTPVSTSAVYTLTLDAAPNATITYKAFFKQITTLEDGKAYRIAGKMSNGTLRYIYRNGTTLKWSTTKDETNNSIFIAQSNGNGSLNLISAVGDYGWQYNGTLGVRASYATLKTVVGTVDGTFTLYAVNGTENRSYTTYSSNTSATSDNINFYTDRNGNGNINKTVDNKGTTNFIFEEVPFTFNVNVADGSNAKLGTINLPFATTVPPTVTVYGVEKDENGYVYVAPIELENDVLPANTPVLVEAEESGAYGFAPAPASDEEYVTGFTGTLAAETIAATTNAYILSYDGAGTAIKFYKLSSTGTERTINANKAYYVSASASPAMFYISLGRGTTDLDEVETEEVVETIYDLQGRKLSEITVPGIYIVNGKKIFVK